MESLYALTLGYLLGSIPFGLILTNLFGEGNLREIGSGNIGATNVLRTGNKGLALATLLLDGAKGFAAVPLGALVAASYDPLAGAVLGGFAALVGHCFPVWLRFKGGKGVATMMGVAFAADWKIGLAAVMVWLAAALITRVSSVGGMAGAIAAPVAAFVLYATYEGGLLGFVYRAVYFIFGLGLSAMALIVVFQHRANIARLRAGTEPKIGQKG
jgi:glycerol-3-phosphate acyltransferase PlsY